jgi:nicotinate dehydrogenase subunit A
MSYRISVNGASHVVDASLETPLLYGLCNDLGLNGPKFGCGLGQCGACAALEGGKLGRTCSIALRDVGDAPIVTLEGLGTGEKPHPLQRTFIDEQAAQCGYCSNGMIMAAKALLDQNRNPSDDEICLAETYWLSGIFATLHGPLFALSDERRTSYLRFLACDSGQVLNPKAAERRAAQWIRSYVDRTYTVDPPFENWEVELHAPPGPTDIDPDAALKSNQDTA